MSSNSDVTSGEHSTLWLDTAKVPTFQPLGSKEVHADVCVVGGGIAGLTTAYMLTCEKKKVVLLECRELMSGESGRTTAHLMSALDDRFYQIKKMHGGTGAELAAESNIEAIDIIEEIVKKEKIDCDFERLNGYLFSHNPSDTKELEEEIHAAIEAGHTGARLAPRAPLPGMDTGKAILFPKQGQFHPVKYMAGLADAIIRNGGEIYTHTRASEFNGGINATVKTTDKGLVNCSNIVVATCNPVANSFAMILKQEPYRTYAIVGEVPKGSVTKGLYWDTQDPYHYLRLAPKDATSDWVITGGEDHRVGRHPENIEQLYEKLAKWTKERVPQFGEVKYKWSGEVWEPIDLLGYIGHNPSSDKNVYVISGDSGTGMTNSTVGAMVVTDMILGRENPYTEVYNPTRRPPLRAIAEMVRGLTEGSVGYLKWLKAGDVTDIEDIKPCSGAIMLENHKYVAVYRDENQCVHKCSGVCSHLGGIVRWNDDEKSWDCPCHGSRFDKFGKVISGPANKDLDKV